MNHVSLLPAVSAYCEERIRELEKPPENKFDLARVDELRRIVILCEGLEKQQILLTKMVQPVPETKTYEVRLKL